MTSISGGSGPTFRIGTSPTNFARFAQTSTPGWGSALARLGGAFAERHRRGQKEAADLSMKQHQNVKRRAWMQSIGEGATLRDIAGSDPSVLGDSAFLSFIKSTKAAPGFTDVTDDEGNVLGQRGPDNKWYKDPRSEPEAEVETHEVVQNPFGRGGVGQESSISGKISGYQGPLAATPERERRTATDRHGRLRYLDDQTPAFSDETLGPAQEAKEPPLKDRLAMVRNLSADWQNTTLPMQGLLEQADRMNIGFKMAENGDLLAGSQAILISFNKMLDPSSVVRESEYSRSASGQSALETMKGFVDKLSQGGAGVTLAELETYRAFGEMVVENTLKSTVGPERKRIGRLIEYAGVDPSLVFTGRFAPKPPQGEATQGLPQAAAPALSQAAPGLGRTQEAPSPTVSRLAEALTSGPAPAPAPAPAATPPVAGQGQAVDPERLKMYSQVPPAVLRRQVEDMAAALAKNPAAYTQEEVDAASAAFERAFPGER